MSNYHVPVLLEESIGGLAIDKGRKQIFVDLTYGGGSHSAKILQAMGKESFLFAFDQDADALVNRISDERLIFVEANFRYFAKFLRLYEVFEVDGILADLGVSSFQLDEKTRGFSYRDNQKLDMRMNINQKLTAADILNRYSEEELVRLFSEYGEVRNSRQLAKKIISDRQRLVFSGTNGFIDSIQGLIMGNRIKYLSQVFQALRIEVNDEINSLSEMLTAAAGVLKSGGRLSVISYHSLEDRLVKNLIKKGNVSGQMERDNNGNRNLVFREVEKGVIEPGNDELRKNTRSRSAKLRIAEKI
ncbi:MAG: 16S rRNA (cytosine(1402)-N(4))-methyltransferase RsmH [Deltaproteobacteria bacterium]